MAGHKSAHTPRVVLTVENLPLARDHRLQKQVRSLLGNGYDVSVICRSDPHNRDYLAAGNGSPRARLCEYPAPRDGESKLGFVCEYSYSLAMAGRLLTKIAFTTGFDVFQASGTPDIYFTIAMPFKLLGKPFVMDQRDLSPELYQARYGQQTKMDRILRLLERRSYRAASHVITVNESLAQTVRERGGRGREAISIVGNGPWLQSVDTAAAMRTAPPAAEIKRGKKYLVCWLGLMNPQDQLELALRAVDHVVHRLQRTDCRFLFIGDGESRPAAERLSRDLQLEDAVTFTGWLPQHEVFGYLAQADLGIDSNLEQIVSPVKCMEYMGFGIPVVAFDTRETRALVQDAAAYAPLNDVAAFGAAIDQLLSQPERRAAMGRSGRDRLEQEIAWEHQEAVYLQVLERLLAGRAPSGAVRMPKPQPAAAHETAQQDEAAAAHEAAARQDEAETKTWRAA